jgi:hypothetical protein
MNNPAKEQISQDIEDAIIQLKLTKQGKNAPCKRVAP